VRAVGNEADARAIFLNVFTALFQQGARKEFLLTSQIQPDWLP
jgi:hypothetical protein